MFIQIEGIDGVGKTTQCLLLQAWLATQSIPAIIVKELDSTNFGKKVRGILSQGTLNATTAEMFLFLASKSQAFSEVILPALAKGQCVITDRGDGSFISYNASLGIDKVLLTDFLNVANFGTIPDITILIDLPIVVAQQRIGSKSKKSRFDVVSKPQLERQAQQFMMLARSMPNWVVVDGSPKEKVVHKQIVNIIQKARGN